MPSCILRNVAVVEFDVRVMMGHVLFFFFLRVEKIRKKEAVQSVWPRVHHYNRAETAQHYAAAHPIRKTNGKSSITAGAPYFPKTYANIDSISRLSTVHNYIH